MADNYNIKHRTLKHLSLQKQILFVINRKLRI